MLSACQLEERVSSVASIMTNASALTALQSLNTTNKSLEMTQARISTGFRVATASDNAAYWSIATTMRSDKSSLSVVQDALGLGAGKVDTAYSALEKTIARVNEIKDKLVAATGASADRQGQDPDRNRGPAGAAEDGRRRRHLLRFQLAVAEHHHRHRRRRRRRSSPRSFRPSPAARPARSPCRRSTSRSRASSSTKPTQAPRQSRRAFSTACASARPARATITATVAVGRHGRC